MFNKTGVTTTMTKMMTTMIWTPNTINTSMISSMTMLMTFANFTQQANMSMMTDAANSSDKLFPVYYISRRPVFDGIDRWTTPIWYVLGIPGNVISCLVWSRRRLRHSSGVFLAALALNESIFLVLQIFFELQFKWHVALLQYPVMCQLFPVLFLATQYLSPLLVLGFTVERYVAVCRPFDRERCCTTSRALRVIVTLVALSVSVNSAQAYFWMYDGAMHACTLREEVKASGSQSLFSIWSWVTEMIVFGFVPLSILLLNVLVILETRRLARAQARLLQWVPGRRLASTRSPSLPSDPIPSAEPAVLRGGPSAMTVLLLVVSFYLITTTLPVTILYVLYLGFDEGDQSIRGQEARWNDPTWRSHFTYVEVRTVVEEIGVSHYALNFYIYLFVGRAFRAELRRLCGICASHGSGACDGSCCRNG